MRKIGIIIIFILLLNTSVLLLGATTNDLSGSYTGKMTLDTINEKFIGSYRTPKEKENIARAVNEEMRNAVDSMLNNQYKNILSGVKASVKEGSIALNITKNDQFKSVAKGDYIVYTNAYNRFLPALSSDGNPYWIAYNDKRNGDITIVIDSSAVHLSNSRKDESSGATYTYKLDGGVSGNKITGTWAQLWDGTVVYAGTFQVENIGGTNPAATKPSIKQENPDPSDSGCRFSAMTGQVEVFFPGAADWKLAKLDTVIPIGTRIRTQEDSSAILNFKDLSTFVLKADSEVVVITPPEKESKIKLVAGNIWANIKQIVNEGSFEIEMNQAAASIKGTTFVCAVKADGTSTLKVIEGKVEFTGKADGKMVVVEGGNMVSADQKGLGNLEKFDTAKEIELWDKVKNEATPKSYLPIIIGAIAVIIILGIGVRFVLMKKHKV